MKKEALAAGYYQSPHCGSFHKIQTLTIDGLLKGTERAVYPDLARGGLSFKAYQFTIPFVTVNGLIFSAVVNFVIYYFVCRLIAWIYRKAKWPENRVMIVVLAFPLVTSVCAVIQFVSATATAIAK
jgi:hypothetical protein